MPETYTAPASNYPIKTSLGPFDEMELKQQFIQNTSLTSIIEPTCIYSSSGHIEWKKTPLNSLTFLVAKELGFESSAIVHWDLGKDEHGNVSIDVTKQNIERFNQAFNYHSCALRWPNSGITDCLMRGNAPAIPIHEQLGLYFNPEKKVGKGKKRLHIFGLSEGAFLHNVPSTGNHLNVSANCILEWETELDVPNDTNDGGGSIRRSALTALMEHSNIPYDKDTIKKIDAVQLVIITAEQIIKGIFVVVEDHELNTDLLVPEPSLVYELTSSKYTMGKVNTIRRKKHKGTTTLEPLQVVPNYLNFADHKEVTKETYLASLQNELDNYCSILSERNLLQHFDQIQEESQQLPFRYQLDELSTTFDMETSEEMRAFIKACGTASGNSPYVNTVMMEQTMSGPYRHLQKLIKHWKGLPGIVISGGRHYITYAPHCAEEDPPEGYIKLIYWKDVCKTCQSSTCQNHFRRDIRRIAINPNDCNAHVRDLLDGFDMDDSCFWTLLRNEQDILHMWIGRNPMSPDRGLLLRVTPFDEQYLINNGYRPLTQTGQWRNPDLWKIEETLKLGELETKPEWTWEDSDDLETCFLLSSKTGGLGQLALYTSAFQYTGQWDVEKHHILNSNVVDAQVNADADIEWTVNVMHKYFVDTFIEEKQLMSKYIANRMTRMFAATGISPDAFRFGNSPKLDTMSKGLNTTDKVLGYRDELRKLLSNGTATQLTREFDTAIVAIILTAAKQIRHLWTNHFAKVRQYDAALINDDIDNEQYDNFVTQDRRETSKTIKALILDHYQFASQLPHYQVGDFAAAWVQVQATKETRFNIFEHEKYPKPISVTPLMHLPEQENITCFYNTFTQPTWISRLIPNDSIIKGGVYTVEQDQTGICFLMDGENNIAGTLLQDAEALVGHTVQYVGLIPRHHDWIEGSTENWDSREPCGAFNVKDSVWTNKLTE